MNRLHKMKIGVLALMLLGPVAPANAATAVLPGCNNPLDSALNQYCDAIPTPVGRQPPRPGTPALQTTLPPQAVIAIGRASATRRLLRLPASVTRPKPPARSKHALLPALAPAPTVSSFPLWIILLLVIVALVLSGVAIERWRRQRPPA